MKFNLTNIFLNVLLICSLIFMFCCAGNNRITINEETKKEMNYIPYYLKVYEADSLYLVGNYERSFEILDSLFQEFEPLNMAYTTELDTYLRLSFYQAKNIDALIKKLVIDWGYNAKTFENDSVLNKILVSSQITDSKMKSWYKLRSDQVDFNLRSQILDILKTDEYTRVNIDKIDSMRYFDSINNLKMKEILLTKGYPNPKLIGVFGEFDNEILHLGVFFNHMAYNGDYNFYNEKLLEFVRKGKCTPEVLSMMRNRYSELISKEPTKYIFLNRSYIIQLFNDKQFDVIRDFNIENKKIGLASIEYQRFKFGF